MAEHPMFQVGDFVKMKIGTFGYGDKVGMVVARGGRWFRRGYVKVCHDVRYKSTCTHWIPERALERVLSESDERLYEELLS